MRTEVRENFPHLATIGTRWMDNDMYGHVNNVVYYSYFDTAVNAFLITAGALDVAKNTVVGVVVETSCTYFQSISFPDVLEVGIRVSRVGNSSVRYDVAIFKQGEPDAKAAGQFTHVYVDRATGRPHAVPDDIRALLLTLHAPTAKK